VRNKDYRTVTHKRVSELISLWICFLFLAMGRILTAGPRIILALYILDPQSKHRAKMHLDFRRASSVGVEIWPSISSRLYADPIDVPTSISILLSMEKTPSSLRTIISAWNFVHGDRRLLKTSFNLWILAVSISTLVPRRLINITRSCYSVCTRVKRTNSLRMLFDRTIAKRACQ